MFHIKLQLNQTNGSGPNFSSIEQVVLEKKIYFQDGHWTGVKGDSVPFVQGSRGPKGLSLKLIFRNYGPLRLHLLAPFWQDFSFQNGEKMTNVGNNKSGKRLLYHQCINF